jgi:hypothetical protein
VETLGGVVEVQEVRKAAGSRRDFGSEEFLEDLAFRGTREKF